MGFRRLRGRLDQIQGNANFTMAQAQELIALGKALVDDLQDGFGVTIHVDEGAVRQLLAIAAGKPGKLPLRVEVDPRVDT